MLINSCSQTALHKSDVGDFQAGYFVMVDTIKENQLPMTRPKNVNKTPERYPQDKRKSESLNNRPQQQRERSTKDLDYNTREGDTNVSPARITTSPTRSPTRSPTTIRNRRHSSSQVGFVYIE
jgi:hypothetical protein